jgi:hypothetical protein
MTLVAAYEHLIGARGTEIKDGDPIPPSTAVAPVIAHPSEVPPIADVSAAKTPAATAAAQTEETAAVRAKPPHKRRHVHKKRRRPHAEG